jgi:hypothetical protein
MRTEVDHLTTAEKTTAIIVLAEALQSMTLVGNPAPVVQRLLAWMDAPLQLGDLVVEMSTKHSGPSAQRVGMVNEIRHSRRHHDTIVEILVVDPPCGDTACVDRKCIHRPRWTNASFVRIPITPEQLAEAIGRPCPGAAVDRDALVSLLSDAGVAVPVVGVP